MTLKKQSLILLFATTIFSLIIISFHAADCNSTSGNLTIYWGQNLAEGSLQETCESGSFNIVILAFLDQFGPNIEPKLNFTGHCDQGAATHTCHQILPSQIAYCQKKGIEVFLSIGSGKKYSYDIPTAAYAKELSTFLWNNFLSGLYGPLGRVTLDGIDFFIKHNTRDYVDELAKQLIELRDKNNGKFYLSASPNWEYNNESYLGPAIKNGRFHYIWVQFYNKQTNICEYEEEDNDHVYLFRAWHKWSSKIPSNSVLFLGLSASEHAVLDGGYIKPEALKNDVLPTIKQASNYGGVMLWNRYYDVSNDPSYSDQIKDAVGRSCRCVCDDDSFGFYGVSRKPIKSTYTWNLASRFAFM